MESRARRTRAPAVESRSCSPCPDIDGRVDSLGDPDESGDYDDDDDDNSDDDGIDSSLVCRM
jgi:hypothetical protein